MTLLKYFDLRPLQSLECTLTDDKENEIKVYVTYEKDDPLTLAGLAIRRTKIKNLEVIIKDDYECEDYTVLRDAVKEAVRLEERNDCEFLDF